MVSSKKLLENPNIMNNQENEYVFIKVLFYIKSMCGLSGWC
jgi:hypothetical protein